MQQWSFQFEAAGKRRICSGNDKVLVCLFLSGQTPEWKSCFQRKVSLHVNSHGPHLILTLHVGPFRGFMR